MINVHLVNNGLELLSIEDNGNGMTFEDLPYAFLRHATSKISSFNDLYQLHTYGFRGEALASVAATSRVTCTTQPANLQMAGGKIIINGGMEELLIPSNQSSSGTAFYIKNLFFNTPVRLKFIKSKNSEKTNLKKIINAFLLARPDVQFSIKWDDKEKEIYTKFDLNDHQKRIAQVFYPRTKNCPPIIKSVATYDHHQVTLFFSKEASKNSPHKQQYFFLNNRLFYDKTLHQNLTRNLESLWPHGESGHYAVFIEAPPDEIDVNVHPNKTQVKFLKNDVVHALFGKAVKDVLMTITKPSSLSSTSNLNWQESLDELHDTQLTNVKNEGEEKNDSPSSFFHLNGFAFFHYEDNLLLFSKKEYLSALFLNSLQACATDEEKILPLMISEPFQIKSLKAFPFEQLKKRGLEFDLLNNNVIALRTRPMEFPREHLTLLTNALLNFLSQKKIEETKATDLASNIEVLPKNILLEEKCLTSFIKKNMISYRTLSEEILNDLLYE